MRPNSQQVRQTLDRVLASPAFRKSEQCQKFLRYVVEHSHTGEDELLKERNIGIEVFGREPSYDTADDPIVRVRATEVRKRLAQYYGESGAAGDVHFEIPSGSYRVEFHWPAAAKPRRRWMVSALVPIAGIALIIAGLLLRTPAPGVLDQFWAPVLKGANPVLLYCGQPVVYFLSRNVHDKYWETLPPDKQRGSYALPLDPDESIRGRDVIPVTDQ